MIRRFLLYLSAAAWARGIVTQMGLARRAARRFIAGETLDEAVAVTRALNDQGLLVTLDYLGESVASAADTEVVVATYRQLVTRIAQEELRASVSIKLTHLGLDIDEALCVGNVRAILGDAQQHHVPVTIDMESSAYVEKPLRIFRSATNLRFREPRSDRSLPLPLRSRYAGARCSGREHLLGQSAYLEPPELLSPPKLTWMPTTPR